MRKTPVGMRSDYFVSYEDSKGRYCEVDFELKADALKFIKRLTKNKTEGELWTRSRVFPEAN